MLLTGAILLQSGSLKVILVVVFLLLVLIQVLRLEPPWRRGVEKSDPLDLRELAGRTGLVMTPMKPVGMCAFDGWNVECISESGYIQKGRTVRVVRVERAKVTVQAIEEA